MKACPFLPYTGVYYLHNKILGVGKIPMRQIGINLHPKFCLIIVFLNLCEDEDGTGLDENFPMKISYENFQRKNVNIF